jgi:hypothetical protein
MLVFCNCTFAVIFYVLFTGTSTFNYDSAHGYGQVVRAVRLHVFVATQTYRNPEA